MNILLKKRIMRRIYLIWFARSVYAKIIVLGAVLITASFHISFVHVFSNTLNASTDFSQSLNYIFSSFAAADAISKVMSAGIIITAIFVGWEFLNTQIKQRILS